MEDETEIQTEETTQESVEETPVEETVPAAPQMTLEQAYAMLAEQRPDLLAVAQAAAQAPEVDDDEELTFGQWSEKTKAEATNAAYVALSTRNDILSDLEKFGPDVVELGKTVLTQIPAANLAAKDARMIITRAIVGDAAMTGKLYPSRTSAPKAGNQSVSTNESSAYAPEASAFEAAFGFKITDKEIKEALGGVN